MAGRVAQVFCVLVLLFSATLLPAGDSKYSLKEGETLFSVSRRAQVPVDILVAYNGISDASRLKPGTVIRVPSLYTVKKGDTLFSIARGFTVSLGRILDLNKLPQDARIRVGDRLYIPEAAGSAPRQAAQVASQQSAKADPRVSTVQEGAPPSWSIGSAVWPHGGKREPIAGKITGLVIHGAAGDVVHSATAGEVKWAASYWGLGKIVIIKSGDGSIFTYGGNEELLVNVGDRVGPGTEIARLGDSPQGGGAKLYFSIKDANGKVVDPEKFFSAKS
jgi:lipoprotein YgeR